jgi:cation:H+ antiporter
VCSSDLNYENITLRKTLVNFAVSAVFIIGAGIWLAMIGDQISESTGLGGSFVGSLLIGLTTTLPEITVSYSALKIGAVDLAVSNMLGSNMFNMFLICIDDLMYTKGAILGAISPNNWSPEAP